MGEEVEGRGKTEVRRRETGDGSFSPAGLIKTRRVENGSYMLESTKYHQVISALVSVSRLSNFCGVYFAVD
jgi:hypothetical protein